MAESPQSTALAHAEPTDSTFEETRRAEQDLVRWIVGGIAVAVPVCVVLFMLAVGFDVSYESAALGGPLAMAAAVGILAGLFFVTSLLLSILAGVGHKPSSILEGGQSAPTAPGAPPPLGGGSGGLLNQLQGGPPRAAPATPAAPSGPQVPQSK